jgi:hypothetical protein
MKGLIAAGMHYIHAADGQEELFSLNSDPEERFNLAGLPQAKSALEGFRRTMHEMLQSGSTNISSTYPRDAKR